MSYELVNGKLRPRVPDGKLDAPTPSQIAERAYDLAIQVAFDAMRTEFGPHEAASVRAALQESKAEQLADLRQSVIAPGVIPWWRK